MRFLNSAKIWVQSGHGGAGAASFRREKFIEFGGPNGGDGGRGGHVIAVADPALNTLIDFRYRQHFKAKSGQAGMKQERTGKGGEDIHLRLPVGTQIYAEDGVTLLADLLTPGQEVTICRGGDGGRGNVHFKTSTNRAPRRAEPGWPGEERWIWLELKLLADAGLVGLPNAGKSTFLAAVSRATPKIADYPFTTLEPMLGTILLGDDSFTIADIPGLIAGASEGKGLGDRFLGHIERCAALIHLVDATQEDVVGAWRTIRRELEELRPGPDRQARAALPLQDRRGGADRARAEEAQAQAGGQDRDPPDLGRRPPGARPGPPRRRGAGPGPAPRRRRDGARRRRLMDRLAKALSARRLVVKVGSALLVEPGGRVREAWLDGLARDVARLRARGQQVAIVTSGAVALGRNRLGLPQRPLRLEEKQAAAASGQILLARAWQESLARTGLEAAQILITLDDTEARRRYLNARATIETLLRLGIVPVVNENDTVATNEIRFGDNDRLSARVAVMALAETLVLLSDVDGLYTADPRRDPAAPHLPIVEAITPEIEAMAGGSGSLVGTGGMASKLIAAKIATASGCAVVLAHGQTEQPLAAVEAGARCTLFTPTTSPRRARKDWIAASLAVVGSLRIDAGAVAALKRGSSLLPAGVTAIEGGFERGDAVLVRGPDDTPIAKGLAAFDAADAKALVGRRTDEIEAVLGYRGRAEMVHRDDLVLL